VDGDCSHEIKRRLLMTNLNTLLKSRDVTLLTKICIVKSMLFPEVMYGCESWTIQKAEHWRIEHSLALSSFGTGMKMDLFQSYGHYWVFQFCWHIECSTLIASFRIWNGSSRIPSPPLALFIMMFPKGHLTSHSRMSGSKWVIIYKYQKLWYINIRSF